MNRIRQFASPVAGVAGQRFAINLEERFIPPLSVTNPAFGAIIRSSWCSRWASRFERLDFNPFAPGNLWVPTALPFIREKFPEGWDSLRGGFRTNTTLGGFNFGLSYFHTQNYDPVLKRGDIIPGVFDPERVSHLEYYPLVHPNIDIFGAYMNKQLPWPGVLRAEAIYVPNKPFGTFDLRDSDAIVRRDYVKYMIAYDLNSFLYFQWHKTAPFDITFEHVGEVIPDNKNLQYIIYDTEVKKWNPSFNMRISTNWLYNLISTELIAGYIPWGNSGLIMPAVKYMPSWLNQSAFIRIKVYRTFSGIII